jgi:eight-cysteine-cluster-containing protein
VLLLFLFACGAKSAPASEPGPAKPPATANDCVKTGCSGTVCAEPGNEAVTTCEFRPEYACYRDAACERQADGKCGWTQTPALTACLASAPAGATGDTPQ